MSDTPKVLPFSNPEAWRSELEMKWSAVDKAFRPDGSEHNAVLCLLKHPDWKGVIVYDAFRDRVTLTRPAPWAALEAPQERKDAWTDTDTMRLVVWLKRELKVTFTREKCEGALAVVAEVNQKHAVREHLNGLAWDGRPRIDGLFHLYFGAEANDYTRAASISFLIGAVARIMTPGCQLDTLPILEGPQGLGKSSACRILAGEWFSDSAIDFGTKDSYQQLPGVWLYELSELDALNRRDVARVKAFVSGRFDRYRPSYGRRTVDVPRQVAFVGTTNADAYLPDDTGNRRFNPIKCTRIDIEALRRDRAQLWAEAVRRFNDGEAWHFGAATANLAALEQEDRRLPDPWEASVATWLRGRIRSQDPVTTTDVLSGLEIEIARHDRFSAMRVASVLRALGWERKRVMIDNVRTYRFFPPGAPPPPQTIRAASPPIATDTEEPDHAFEGLLDD